MDDMLNVNPVTEQYNDLSFVSFFLTSLYSLTNFLMGDVGNDSVFRLPVSQENKVGQVYGKAKTLIFLT